MLHASPACYLQSPDDQAFHSSKGFFVACPFSSVTTQTQLFFSSALPSPVPRPLPPQRVLGTGGHATVYEAMVTGSCTPIALKVLDPRDGTGHHEAYIVRRCVK